MKQRMATIFSSFCMSHFYRESEGISFRTLFYFFDIHPHHSTADCGNTVELYLFDVTFQKLTRDMSESLPFTCEKACPSLESDVSG